MSILIFIVLAYFVALVAKNSWGKGHLVIFGYHLDENFWLPWWGPSPNEQADRRKEEMATVSEKELGKL